MQRIKTIPFYAGNHLKGGSFLATYRGLTLLELENNLTETLVHLNTHGFVTRTTVRVLNQAFADVGLAWSANIKRGQVVITLPDREVYLGDKAYSIRIA